MYFSSFSFELISEHFIGGFLKEIILFLKIIWIGTQRFGTLEGQSWVSWRYLSDGNAQNGWGGYQKFKYLAKSWNS